MTCLYTVRCNFSNPAVLADWEHWYSGEKQDWLLSRPGFIAGQRFSAVSATDGVTYLALYALDSPEALTTPEYLSGWGWAGYRPYIVDWSRNFFEGVDPEVFLTVDDELLRVVFVERSGHADAAAETSPGLTWVGALPGLDGSLDALGLAAVAEAASIDGERPKGIEQGVFRPASPARYAEGYRAQ
ncbi:hypothetical protein [Nocardia miyunensis]|uniref:hypothetical protein n=1 Tax=Nocardia miyunensis TaxID=282684 RepID=UPI000836EF30|nr:hypothetical protein [Nocardia miyunensis]